MIGEWPAERVLRLPAGLGRRVLAIVADEDEGTTWEAFLLEGIRRHLEAAELRQFRRQQEATR